MKQQEVVATLPKPKPRQVPLWFIGRTTPDLSPEEYRFLKEEMKVRKSDAEAMLIV